MKKGQICRIHSDFYYVDDGENVYECKIREVLKKRGEKILTGDFVEFGNGVIENILPRKNFIPRPSAANIDQVIIVSALKEPDLSFVQLDRYIALAKYYNIPVKLCFNKEDLVGTRDKELETSVATITNIYEPLGYEVLFTSATEHQGIEEFKKVLSGKTSVLCGNSGVGKSSLINAISPDLSLKIGAVSEKTQRGTHTTRHCEIIKLETRDEGLETSKSGAHNNSTQIIDTPGFSNVKFDFLLPAEVSALFNEFNTYPPCKFSDCLHINEVGCAILEGIASNIVSADNSHSTAQPFNHSTNIKIAPSRYKSYLEFIAEAREYKEKVTYSGKKTETTRKVSGGRETAKISERKRRSARNTEKQKIYKETDE